MRVARFLAMCLASVLSSLTAIGAFNAVVDPYGEFGTGLVRPDDSDRHSRALKVALLREAPEAPEAIILGNSRSMQLAPATVRRLTGLSTFNASTAAASSFDLLAFTRIALARSPRLRTLIVGLDTFMLHPAGSSPDGPRPELLYFPMVRYLPEIDPPLRAQLERLGRTTSVVTAGLSARQLYYRTHPRVRNFAFEADGKIQYLPYDDWVEAGRWPGPIPAALGSVWSEYLGDFNADPEPTPRAMAALEEWLADAERAHLEVFIFLPPLHSFLKSALEKQSRYGEHVAAYHRRLRALQTRFPFTFRDLSSVDRFGGDDRWFIDGTHMIGPNNDLVLAAVLEDASGPGRRPSVDPGQAPAYTGRPVFFPPRHRSSRRPIGP